MRILKVIGGFANLYTTYKQVMHYKDDLSYGIGDSILTGVFGYNPTDGADNSFASVSSRLLGAHWPAITGTLASEVMFNADGAFGTGQGMKLNRHTPKGMNF